MVPLAYDKLSQLPYDTYGETHGKIKQSIHKIQTIMEQIRFVQEACKKSA